ncbi:MurR/RpiR family transcriptional regulator [Virgibacillus dakarensis]|uniref:MurR/RpiR family transcriptional regulator n=1 Tax=Virgibacillus dakarensis TaxID=1917889 RepID=UPI0013566FEA|nr:MurR/RpiR family transcriptional regulator [Virgibacillus dakarensis]
MSLFNNIQVAIDSLSDAKKNVAYYILDNWVEVAFLSASRVAKNAGVSESVVVRFSQDLNFSGFPELQKELQKILKSRLVNPIIEIPSDTNDHEITNNDLLDIYSKSIRNIDEIFNKNPIDTYIKFLDKILEANKILILARQNSFGPAYLLNVHLNEVFAKSKILDGESVEALDYIRGFTNKDLVIFISIPSYSKRMKFYSDYLSEKEIPQIAITNSHLHHIGKNADVLLLTRVDSLSFSNSHLGTIFIIDILIYLLTVRSKGELLRQLEDIKILNERFGITE